MYLKIVLFPFIRYKIQSEQYIFSGVCASKSEMINDDHYYWTVAVIKNKEGSYDFHHNFIFKSGILKNMTHI